MINRPQLAGGWSMGIDNTGKEIMDKSVDRELDTDRVMVILSGRQQNGMQKNDFRHGNQWTSRGIGQIRQPGAEGDGRKFRTSPNSRCGICETLLRN
jgi:hypothetical protein